MRLCWLRGGALMFPAVEVRILHAQPAVAADGGPSRLVTVRYVVVSEAGARRMGAAEVDVHDIGHDFDVQVERITKGPALPVSLHSEIEEAACAAYQHASFSWARSRRVQRRLVGVQRRLVGRVHPLAQARRRSRRVADLWRREQAMRQSGGGGL